MSEGTEWLIPSNRGLIDFHFVVQGFEPPDRVVGQLELRGWSPDCDRQSGSDPAWTMSMERLSVTVDRLQSVHTALDDWLSARTPFRLTLASEGPVRVALQLVVEDASLILGPGKAELRVHWDSIGVPSADVAFVVDDTCVSEAAGTLGQVLGKLASLSSAKRRKPRP